MPGIYLALGSNLGNREANIRMALRMLAPLARVDAVSPFYESTPQPPAPGPDYVNAACRIITGIRPQLLLNHTKRIEAEIGRLAGERWAPRVIDIDIALYNDEVVDESGLAVPHPRLPERDFVLQPLLDLDAGLVHPASEEPLLQMLSRAPSNNLRRLP